MCVRKPPIAHYSCTYNFKQVRLGPAKRAYSASPACIGHYKKENVVDKPNSTGRDLRSEGDDKALFEAITARLPMPMLIHRAGEIRYINHTCVSLLGGHTADEFIGTSIGDVIHPDYQPDAFDRVQRIMMGESNVESIELKLVRKDGKETWIETTGITVPYEGQSAIYVIGQDISDRKRIQEQELYQLSNAVANGYPLEQLGNVALQVTEHVLGTRCCAIVLMDDDNTQRFTASHDLSLRFQQAVIDCLPSDRRSALVEPTFWSDLSQPNAAPQLSAAARDEGLVALGCVPLAHKGSLSGLFLIFHRTPHAFTDSEIQLAKTIAFHIALGVERKISETEIHKLAYFDPLTKLANRRRLYDEIRSCMSISTMDNQFGAVLFIDLDYFKVLNDTRGHAVGDVLLCTVAQRLQRSIASGNSVARLGGDEFVVLLQGLGTDAQAAARRANQCAHDLRGTLSQPYAIDDQEYHSTPSIGIALFRGSQESVDNLIKRADIAMYQAKGAGRNAVRLFDEAIQVSLEARLTLENDLHRAIVDKQLALHYQIQVNQDNAIEGVEALLRWQHPQKGMIAPSRFIGLAEDTGLILPIGNWVLQAACEQIKAWSTQPALSRLRISVNVSSVQFAQDDFVSCLRDLIKRTEIPPDRLKLELTESVVLQNVNEVIEKMQELNAMGIRLSIDDFGTGFSSLTYLKQLPLQQLKIDQSFVRDLVGDTSDKAIVQAIVTMGDAFGLNVIAEGVETEVQRKQLQSYGCNSYQGYLFSHPLALEPLEELVTDWGTLA
jgi:diguanylate cyclase (GGDEF)-like protein/PAS domain S-box-containing protein